MTKGGSKPPKQRSQKATNCDPSSTDMPSTVECERFMKEQHASMKTKYTEVEALCLPQHSMNTQQMQEFTKLKTMLAKDLLFNDKAWQGVISSNASSDKIQHCIEVSTPLHNFQLLLILYLAANLAPLQQLLESCSQAKLGTQSPRNTKFLGCGA